MTFWFYVLRFCVIVGIFLLGTFHGHGVGLLCGAVGILLARELLVLFLFGDGSNPLKPGTPGFWAGFALGWFLVGIEATAYSVLVSWACQPIPGVS